MRKCKIFLQDWVLQRKGREVGVRRGGPEDGRTHRDRGRTYKIPAKTFLHLAEVARSVQEKSISRCRIYREREE